MSKSKETRERLKHQRERYHRSYWQGFTQGEQANSLSEVLSLYKNEEDFMFHAFVEGYNDGVQFSISKNLQLVFLTIAKDLTMKGKKP